MGIEFLKEYGEIVSERIYEFLSSKNAPKQLIDAMLYSVGAGGKRLRPSLMMQFAKALGCEPELVLDFACAVEMIHTYSLIHDDLPCMDNDDVRRGKPSCHIAFGEDIALLAGDSLLTAAFEIASESEVLPQKAVMCIGEIAKASGMCGMCAGQCLDLESENKQITADELKEIHKGKTVAMIEICAKIPCIIADADEETTLKCLKYCEEIGLAFQIQDDILDVIGDETKLGKPINSDGENKKNTYVSFYGLDECKRMVEEMTVSAINCVSKIDEDGRLRALAEYLAQRDC